MKATKALKCLTKIEASMSDVTDRYVTIAPAVRKALRDAMAAVTMAKDAVGFEVSSGTAATSPPALKKAKAAKPAPAKKASKKATAKKAVKTSTAKAATKTAPVAVPAVAKLRSSRPASQS
jgi:hypothetical protein